MSAQLMDGKALAAQKKAAIRAEVERLARTPGLAVVLVGENPASQIYVRGKARDCEECGIRCMDFRLPAQTTERGSNHLASFPSTLSFTMSSISLGVRLAIK